MRRAVGLLYVLLLVAVLVVVDLTVMRGHIWRERVLVNVGIVLLFGAFYWTFLRRR
jgi:hypothetical protein